MLKFFGFALLMFVPIAGLSAENSNVTNLARLPIFCDVAGHYKGKYSDGSWTANINPYTGIASMVLHSAESVTFIDGVIRKTKDTIQFSVDLQNGSSWRGKIIFSEATQPILEGKWINFDSNGTFNAIRENVPNAVCDTFLKAPQSH
ncbi:MAG: hypothetical protein V4525_08175 [Pseudomonadota bacterium]